MKNNRTKSNSSIRQSPISTRTPRSSTSAGRSVLSSLSTLSSPSTPSSPLTMPSRSIAVKGHLSKVVMDRYKAVQGLKLEDIRPKPIFTQLPNKQNNYAFPRRKRPANLYHRVLNYIDQFATPVAPKQVVHHFTHHPTNRVPKLRVYAQMKDLIKSGAMYKSVRVDEEGNQHYFYGTTVRSQKRHKSQIEKLMKQRKALPLDEVVWQNLDALEFAQGDLPKRKAQRMKGKELLSPAEYRSKFILNKRAKKSKKTAAAAATTGTDDATQVV